MGVVNCEEVLKSDLKVGLLDGGGEKQLILNLNVSRAADTQPLMCQKKKDLGPQSARRYHVLNSHDGNRHCNAMKSASFCSQFKGSRLL